MRSIVLFACVLAITVLACDIAGADTLLTAEQFSAYRTALRTRISARDAEACPRPTTVIVPRGTYAFVSPIGAIVEIRPAGLFGHRTAIVIAPGFTAAQVQMIPPAPSK